MKRRLVLSLCAVALTAICMSSAQAQLGVDVALNLRYNDPADPSEGGTWQLVARTDTAGSQGLVGLTVRISGLDAAGTESVRPNIGHDINSGAIKTGVFGGITEFVYGQDPGIGSPLLVGNVGLLASPSNQANDPLLNNAAWGNVSVIATGTVSSLATRPAFTLVAANENVGGTVVGSTIVTQVVRGDSWEGLNLETAPGTGLFAGDANRDGRVGAGDSALMYSNWDPLGTTNGWDIGDFNDDGRVGAGDSALLFSNWDPLGNDFDPPPITGVPEPTALALSLLAVCGLGVARRRA